MALNMDKKRALNQLQVVTMDYNRQADEPFWVAFSNGMMTKRLNEGQETNGSLVLKNSIVEGVSIRDGFDAFVELFEKIIKLVGQKVPIVKLIYLSIHGERFFTPNQDFVRFRDHYSSMYCLFKKL